jgi:Flp pilus assembly protein TadG
VRVEPRVEPRDERGTITPLIIGFAMVVALLVAVVVDASAAYLRRQGLNSVADAAALAATDGLQGDRVYTHGLDDLAEIDAAAARRYVDDYLRASGALSRFPRLSWSVTTSAKTVVVRVAAPLDLPLRVPGVGDEATVRGSAAAVVVVSD